MKFKYRRRARASAASHDFHNIFAELEYIAAGAQAVHEMAHVHNLVGTSRLLCALERLDLRAICNLLPNAHYEKQKFAAITIRLGHPVCTVLLFTSGKMVLTGCKSMLDCMLASRQVFHAMCVGFPGVVFRLEPVKIQNIVGNAQVRLRAGECLDLERFYADFNVWSTYQPTMFPGLIYRPSDLPVVLLIFFSGKIVITGAKSMRDVYSGWAVLRSLLGGYRLQRPAPAAALASI